MTCAGCANRVTESLHKVPGVMDVNVNFATGEALILAKQDAVDPRDLMAAVAAAGYGGRVLARGEVAEAAPDRALLWPVLLAAACTVPLVAPMVLAPFGVHAELPGWLQFALAAVVQTVCGGRFYRGAVHALRSLTGTMDLLVAMGTTAAFLLSLYHLFIGGPLYFEASAAIITFVLLGHWLERGARLDATAAVRALGALKPETAWLVEAAGPREVDLAELRIGDRILLKPGARVPADGVVESGDG
ncbi:MAG: cation transporter, partial [Alphaproteobacteria bacterium]|nr:cation transporter [Alphaproteobacteria bacterium]